MSLPPFMKSRKFWALIAGALVIILRAYVPNLPIDDGKLTELVLLLVAYILGTALEDAGAARSMRKMLVRTLSQVEATENRVKK